MNKKQSKQKETQKERMPVFTGNYIRDGVVSDAEKATEVALAIYETFNKKKNKPKNEKI